MSRVTITGPVVPTGCSSAGSSDLNPALHHAYKTLTDRSRLILEKRLNQMFHVVEACPAIVAALLYGLAVTTGWIDNLILFTVTTVCLALSAVVGFLAIHTYEEQITSYLQYRFITLRLRLHVGLRTYTNPGELPAGVLQIAESTVASVVRSYTDLIGFTAADIDVCVTLLCDGFEGSVDDICAVARNLRS